MNIIALIQFEEGWRDKPYYCTEGYPTIGFGFKLGPRGAPLANYTFTLPLAAGQAWLTELLKAKRAELQARPNTAAALVACAPFPAREAVLLSMAYQLGVDGLANFKNALANMAARRWNDAADEMLNSRWAKQTPNRAIRHAEQMRTNIWCPRYASAGGN